MTLEQISRDNLMELTSLVLELWPDGTWKDEHDNCGKILGSDKETCILARTDTAYVGFIYLSVRSDYVEGTTSRPAAYIEGLYVRKGYRRTGTGNKLIAAGEEWAKEKGCTQIASDAELDNARSIEFHIQSGFREVNRVVCFVKDL